MQIVRELGGYSLGRADLVRRAMSKKKTDVMLKEKHSFVYGSVNEDGTIEVEGAIRRGIDAKTAEEIFDEMKIEGIDLVSLAKREEEVFTLCKKESVIIDRRDYALKMLQRLRDEAHRFAITYFRTLHDKRNLTSRFCEIEGVGKEKRKALLNEFKTVENVAQASEESLAKVPGIGVKLAKNIKKYFEENF